MARIRRERAYNVILGVVERPKMHSVPLWATHSRIQVLRGLAARPLDGVCRSRQTNGLASRSSIGRDYEGTEFERRNIEGASEQKQALKVPCQESVSHMIHDEIRLCRSIDMASACYSSHLE